MGLGNESVLADCMRSGADGFVSVLGRASANINSQGGAVVAFGRDSPV